MIWSRPSSKKAQVALKSLPGGNCMEVMTALLFFQDCYKKKRCTKLIEKGWSINWMVLDQIQVITLIEQIYSFMYKILKEKEESKCRR